MIILDNVCAIKLKSDKYYKNDIFAMIVFDGKAIEVDIDLCAKIAHNFTNNSFNKDLFLELEEDNEKLMHLSKGFEKYYEEMCKIFETILYEDAYTYVTCIDEFYEVAVTTDKHVALFRQTGKMELLNAQVIKWNKASQAALEHMSWF